MSNQGPFTLATTATDMLKDNLLVTLRAEQDKNTIEAILTPSTFLTNRTNKINALFGTKNAPGKVAVYYEDRIKEYADLHLPEAMVKELANKSVARFYQEQLELLDISQPGAYDKAFGVAQVKHNAVVATEAVADPELYEQYYKKRRQVKKAKKAKRAAKKAAK